MSGFTVRAAEMPRELPIVQKLCWEYRDFLLTFNDEMRQIVEAFYPEQPYAALMDALPEKHGRPRGIIMVAEQDGAPFGCGMTHPLNTDDAEVKRVFVRPQTRGSGAGFELSKALIAQARSDGYKRLLLDTSVHFTAAQKLYEKLGFKLRGPYSELPPDTENQLVFYELML